MTTETFKAALGNFSYSLLPSSIAAIYLSNGDIEISPEVVLNSQLRGNRDCLARTLKKLTIVDKQVKATCNCVNSKIHYLIYKDGTLYRLLALIASTMFLLYFDSNLDGLLDIANYLI